MAKGPASEFKVRPVADQPTSQNKKACGGLRPNRPDTGGVGDERWSNEESRTWNEVMGPVRRPLDVIGQRMGGHSAVGSLVSWFTELGWRDCA